MADFETDFPYRKTRIIFYTANVRKIYNNVVKVVDLKTLCQITEETETYADTFLGSFKGVDSFPLGDLVAIKGQAKSCKSTFLQIVTSSLVGSNRNFGITPNVAISAVHYFDTEQKLHNTKQWLLNAIALGADKNRLKVFNLRKYATQDRKELFYRYVDTLTSGNHLVLLDGIRDLVESPNDEREANEIKDKILALLDARPNVCIACVLHQNPNKEIDGKMRGHLGTEILNKCGSEWVVTANHQDEKNTLSPIVNYTATNSASRNDSVDIPIVFAWENGRVVSCTPSMPMGNTITENWSKVRDLLTDGQYTTATLLSVVMSEIGQKFLSDSCRF